MGDKKVLLGLSGGVDSSVVGVLLQRAIGDQLTSIFVDHGFLRKGEGDQVMNMLGDKFGLNIIRVNAEERFMNKLAGVSDPEKNVKSSVTNLFTSLMMKLLNLKMLNSSLKVPFIQMSSSQEQILLKQSNHITMLAACQKICSSN